MLKRFGALALGVSLCCSSAKAQSISPEETDTLRAAGGAFSGLYSLVADDSDQRGYVSSKNWTPALHQYQQSGFNTLFLTFIRPDTMEVPPAFANFARTKGRGTSGAIPSNTRVIFAIGGIAYSTSINPWPWLTSAGAARDMARRVADWYDRYGADGIDLDIEDGAGNAGGAGENLIAFVKELKRLKPQMLVTLPVYGYPQINAANALVNAAFSPTGTDYGLLDGVGIMVYEGTDALNYIGNYAKIEGKGRWEGFPITAAVPKNKVVVGLKGTASNGEIQTMANQIKSIGLGGFMVWYGSLLDNGQTALQYPPSWDSSTIKTSQWASARQSLGDPSGTPVKPDPQPEPNPDPKPDPQPDPGPGPQPDPGPVGGQCVGAGAYKDLPGMAQWCTDNCRVGNCPATHCVCH